MLLRHDARRHTTGPGHVTGVARKRSPSENRPEMNRIIMNAVFALIGLLSGKLTLHLIFDVYVVFVLQGQGDFSVCLMN